MVRRSDDLSWYRRSTRQPTCSVATFATEPTGLTWKLVEQNPSTYTGVCPSRKSGFAKARMEYPTPTRRLSPLSGAAQNAAASVELTAVLVAVTEGEPRVLIIQHANALPSGPLESDHRTLQMGLRSWVERQTHH